MSGPDERDEAEIEASRAPLLEHLIELRRRLLYAVLAFFAGFILCYVFSGEIYNFLAQPLYNALEGQPNQRLIATSPQETFVTYLYQRHRGATELDAVAPLFWWIRDPRDHSETLLILPVLARWSSPATSNTIVFPFFAHFDEYGRRQTWVTPLAAHTRDLEHGDNTTWIAPTFQYSRWRDGEAFNIYPFWFYEHVPSHRHHVLAPFWFDFEQLEKHDRYTVAFPFYWRFVEGVTETQLFLNTYFRRREWRGEDRWETEFHFAPLFDWGETSSGEHWWRVLYGLIGFEHRARHDRLWLFYIPIDFGHAPIEPAVPNESGAAESALAIPTYTLQ